MISARGEVIAKGIVVDSEFNSFFAELIKMFLLIAKVPVLLDLVARIAWPKTTELLRALPTI